MVRRNQKSCNARFAGIVRFDVGETRVDVPELVVSMEKLNLNISRVFQNTRIGRGWKWHRYLFLVYSLPVRQNKLPTLMQINNRLCHGVSVIIAKMPLD